MTEPCGPRFPGARASFLASLEETVYAKWGIFCVYCGNYLADGLDHVYPWIQGGSSDPANLVPACTVCNSIAGQRVFREFAHKRAYILARRAQLSDERLAQMYKRAALGLRHVGE